MPPEHGIELAQQALDHAKQDRRRKFELLL